MWFRQSVNAVSIHAPARGATTDPQRPTRRNRSFNPRPCARGDSMLFGRPCMVLSVSIHAPARGATRGREWATLIYSFNPRPCARGDHVAFVTGPGAWEFQSTPLREGRLELLFLLKNTASVSIHAPARGATNDSRIGNHCIIVSIHAPARGAT